MHFLLYCRTIHIHRRRVRIRIKLSLYWKKFQFHCISSFIYLFCLCSLVCRVSTHRMEYHHTDSDTQIIHWSRSPIFHSHKRYPCLCILLLNAQRPRKKWKNCFCCDSFVRMREGDNTFNKILLSWNFRHIEVHRGRQAQISDKMASSHICQFRK